MGMLGSMGSALWARASLGATAAYARFGAMGLAKKVGLGALGLYGASRVMSGKSRIGGAVRGGAFWGMAGGAGGLAAGHMMGGGPKSIMGLGIGALLGGAGGMWRGVAKVRRRQLRSNYPINRF